MDEATNPPDAITAVLSERTRLRVPSQPEWITPTIELLKQKALLCGACPEGRLNKLALALHEALTNAVVHGNLEISSELKESDDDAYARALAQRLNDPAYSSRGVQIDIDHDRDRTRWTMTDEGKGFDAERYLRGQPDAESVFLASGRGIMLMRAFVDDLYYELGGRRVTLSLYHRSFEKRQDARHAVHQRVQVAPILADGSVDWDELHEAVARNLSATGMSLLQHQLATSEHVVLGVEVEGRTIYFPARIKHCRSIEPGNVEIGCQFLLKEEPPLPSTSAATVEEVVDALLRHSEPAPSEADERRVHQREAYTEQLEIAGEPGQPPLIGFARNLSKGGVSFICSTALPCEERLLSLSLGDRRVTLRVRVIRCLPLTPGYFEIGARFLAVAAHA